MKIMFICTGNICRSAMAEAMMKKIAEQHHKKVEVCSCGIFADNGDMPTQNAVDTMKQYHIDLTNHRATHIRYSNIKEMDLILCATFSHKISVIRLYPELEDKVFTIKEYAGMKDDLDIKDPWGYDLTTYQNCAKEIQQCLEIIINKI